MGRADLDLTLISIIVPIYNVEKYLKQCIDSLLAQTYENIEIIMVDDGSNDSSGEICDNYANKYEKCKVIHKKNAGLGMARNTGMEHMKGKYVTFVDSDDWVEPDLVKNLYDYLEKNRVDVCKGGFKRRTNTGEIISIRQYNEEIFRGELVKSELLPRMIGSSPYKHDSIEMCVCGGLYSTWCIKEYNLKFPSERELISEDLVFNIDYMQYAKGACTILNSEYNYRINPGSLTQEYRPDRFEASRYFYLTMKKKCEKLGYDKMTIYRLQRMFFINIKVCIDQECTDRSTLSKSEHINNISKICADKVVREVISQYPQKKIGIKQKVFLKLISLKLVRILYAINKRT